MEPRIFENVHLGEGVTVHPGVILGMPPRGAEPGEQAPALRHRRILRELDDLDAGQRPWCSLHVPSGART